MPPNTVPKNGSVNLVIFSQQKAWFDSCRFWHSDPLPTDGATPTWQPELEHSGADGFAPVLLLRAPKTAASAGDPPSLLSGRGPLRGGGYLLKGYVSRTPSREPNRLGRHRASPRRGICGPARDSRPLRYCFYPPAVFTKSMAVAL